eukprot:COSAG05_NODE_1224_length_5470_cov_4.161140_6_plen_217_part_00
MLGREPDSEGRRHFAEIISGVSKQEWPLSVAQVADELLRGDEFGAHHKEGKTLLGADELNTERTGVFCRAMRHFSLKMADVTFLYIKILGRWPDDDAKAHYTQVVHEGGLSVMEMVLELLKSEEYNAQGPLALPKTDFIAQVIVKSSKTATAEDDGGYQVADCCKLPEKVQDAALVRASAVSHAFPLLVQLMCLHCFPKCRYVPHADSAAAFPDWR